MSIQQKTFVIFVLWVIGLAGLAQAREMALGLVLSENRPHRLDAEFLNAATEAFFRTRRFQLMERDRLDAIVDEKGLQEFISALTSGSSLAGMDELEGVDMIGLVSYTTEFVPGLAGDLVKVYYISVRLVSVSTGQILNTIDSRQGGLLDPTTPHLAGNYLYKSIREVYPPIEYIVRLKGTEAIVGMGADMGLKDGDLLEVIRDGEPIFHPVTGKPLPGEETPIGTLKVVRASQQISICKIKKADGALQVGDRVRLKATDPRKSTLISGAKKLLLWKKNKHRW